MQEPQVQSLRQECPLEEEMATHSSVPAGIILWTKKPSGLQSMDSQRARHACTNEHINFCHTSTWISHSYTYVLSLLSLSIASHLSRLSQNTELSPLKHTANSHWLSVSHMVMHMFQCCSLYSSPLAFPHCVHKSLLYVCISIAALKIGSSVPSF